MTNKFYDAFSPKKAIPFETNGTRVYRFQGVALPRGIFLNHAAFRILEERASRLVKVLVLLQSND